MIMIPQPETADDEEERVLEIKDRVDAFFGPESPLRQSAEVGGRPYEDRPQQREMAVAIATALEGGDHLCVEAPTGVGKSFAYLVPAILAAKALRRPFVIVTHTIALQDQLINRDIPLLRKLINEPFSAALAKGRGNYICVHRLHNAMRDHVQFLPSDDLMPEVSRIADWADKTQDGTRSDLDFVPTRETWYSVCAESGTCPRVNDPNDESCFFRRARRRLFAADIIVANHAMYCVDLAMRQEGQAGASILPNYAGVIIDEAHCFEDVAARHLGIGVNSISVFRLLSRLYNARTKRGLLTRPDAFEPRQAAATAGEATTRYFNRLRMWIEQQDENPLVYTTPGHIPNQVASSWIALERSLAEYLDEREDEPEFLEIQAAFTQLKGYREGLDIFLDMARPENVYWFELSGLNNASVTLNVVPIDVRHILREVLFEEKFPVVLTSATLAISGNLNYFRERLGAETAQPMILDSPFNFPEQVELHIPAGAMPAPGAHNFSDAATEQIRRFLEKTGGKAFVLFTSYSAMNQIARELREELQDQGIRLYVQGKEMQRGKMLERFRDDINSVLFGTDSFWTGVDVPGESLSNVIIVKLPFAVPSHPLTAARAERIEAQGGNSFRDYFLPEAILKFRQGVGRLIRGRTDRGIVVVLDPRIVRAGYGAAFLKAIPECPRYIT
ncbi:MAG: ATP-dependent DNA helicase DinG [Rhodothermales bacterium]|jgi:ATP-dependent DNA helicase DinG